MALDLTFLTADFDIVAGDIAQTITFNGTSYACVAGESEFATGLVDVGFDRQSTIGIHVKLSLFGTPPTIGDTLTHESVTYRVESYVDDAGNKIRSMSCAEV